MRAEGEGMADRRGRTTTSTEKTERVGGVSTMMKRSCEMCDTHGCVADNRTFCMISLLSVDCREVGNYGKVSVGRVIGLG